MLFRAIFAIGIVSLLTPHEPDLGLGRPGAGALLPSPAPQMSASGLSRTNGPCGFPACAGAFLSGLLAPAGGGQRSLADVKAEIEADMRARSKNPG
jgi:hypothetical protein